MQCSKLRSVVDNFQSIFAFDRSKFVWSNNMSEQKRKRLLSSCSTSSSSDSDGPVSKRSLVQKRTVKEWKK